jgi:hypothetical protein
MIGTAITWAYAHLLTMSGAYEHATSKGKNHCRTDRAHIIGTTPWYLSVPFSYLYFHVRASFCLHLQPYMWKKTKNSGANVVHKSTLSYVLYW